MSREIESAAGMHLGLCPFCNDLHLYFIDENGDDFAEAVIGPEVARLMLRDLQRALADQAAGNDMSTMQ